MAMLSVFFYQMEGYVIKDDEDFFKDYLLVENGQVVKKGDILGYMYVPTLEEMVGTMQGSSHIAFALMEKRGTSKEQEMAPAIFTEEIVEQFSNLYRNPKEGWESTSYGYDWSRARGLPSSMGWYIGPEEHPFGGEYLDVFFMEMKGMRTLIQNKRYFLQSLDFRQTIIYSINMDMAVQHSTYHFLTIQK